VPEVVEDVPYLARVLGDAPAAAMLVDLHRGEVVSADDLARQLAPDLALPSPLQQWAAAARLQDAGGDDLADGDHPFRRLLRGEPVTGQVVSVARTTGSASLRELRWVVALPLGGAPGLTHLGLVVLFSVRPDAPQGPHESPGEGHGPDLLSPGSVLLDALSYTVADARTPDTPLVWTSPGFTTVTGYEAEDVRGRNCRFLQGPETSADAVDRLRSAVQGSTAVVETLLNYTRDGRPFWNQVTLNPVVDAAGTTTHVVGVQNDVSGRRAAERSRDAALVAAREAQALAARAESRLDALGGSPQDYSTATSRVQVAARYLPAGETLGTGGDFFDVHELSTDRVSVAIGDILGHDVRPGTAITQVQGMITALAMGRDLGPAAILEKVDLVAGSSEDDAATAWLAEMTRVEDDWLLRFSSAGHPPAALRGPEGGCAFLAATVGVGLEPPLGLHQGGRSESVVELVEGSTLVVFSDGLLKRRGTTVDTGLERLLEAVSSGPTSAVALCDHLVDQLVPPDDGPPEDDVVVLAIHLGPLPGTVPAGRPIPDVPTAGVTPVALPPPEQPALQEPRPGRRWSLRGRRRP